MLKVLSYILCDLDPKVKVIGQKAGICDGVPSASALVFFEKAMITGIPLQNQLRTYKTKKKQRQSFFRCYR